MARIARHKGAHYRAAPLAKHIKYLERDGVSRDGRDASMFDAQTDRADRDAFAGRCEDDRHHFRFIVSPEDAGDMEDLRSFTRELMADAAKDLGTELDWVAVDHWNTDNPHIHVLVRGVASDGTDLVIDRGYISEGLPPSWTSAPRSHARSMQSAGPVLTGSLNAWVRIPQALLICVQAATPIPKCAGCCWAAPPN